MCADRLRHCLEPGTQQLVESTLGKPFAELVPRMVGDIPEQYMRLSNGMRPQQYRRPSAKECLQARRPLIGLL